MHTPRKSRLPLDALHHLGSFKQDCITDRSCINRIAVCHGRHLFPHDKESPQDRSVVCTH
jgi:hypothetical protein